MAGLHCAVVTAERIVFDGDVDMVVAPGIEGQLGVLPHHAPLMTALTIGELVLQKKGEEDTIMAIGGGFMEIGPHHVTVLADSAERAEEIDEDRAMAARRRAEATMAQARPEQEEFIKAEAALRRSALRLRVAKRRPGTRGPTGKPRTGR
jgi:F-type H+-transporting ATPase subunit epsilon